MNLFFSMMLIHLLLYQVIYGKSLKTEAEDVWKDTDETDNGYSGNKMEAGVIKRAFPG